MALSDYSMLMFHAAIALVVYAAAAAAHSRGWGSVDYRAQAAVVLLTGLCVQRASVPKVPLPACIPTWLPSFLPSFSSSASSSSQQTTDALDSVGFVLLCGGALFPVATRPEQRPPSRRRGGRCGACSQGWIGSVVVRLAARHHRLHHLPRPHCLRDRGGSAEEEEGEDAAAVAATAAECAYEEVLW